MSSMVTACGAHHPYHTTCASFTAYDEHDRGADDDDDVDDDGGGRIHYHHHLLMVDCLR